MNESDKSKSKSKPLDPVSDFELKLIPINLIFAENRVRTDFTKLNDIKESIRTNGLISPIAVTPALDGSKNYRIIAGETRFKAMYQLNIESKKKLFSQIETKVFKTALNEHQLAVLEGEENFKRQDLSPVEVAKQIAKIHNSYISIYGDAGGKSGGRGDLGIDSGHSQAETARKLGINAAKVTAALQVDHINKKAPGIFDGAKTDSEIKSMIKKASQSVLAKNVIAAAENDKTPENEQRIKLCNSYMVGDFFEGVQSIALNSIDFVEIDPPYGIDLKSMKLSSDLVTSSYNEVDAKDYESFMLRTFQASYKILKPNSWMICWFGPEPWAETIHNLLIHTGFVTNRMYGLWFKGVGQTKNPEYALANSYELFYIARKGSPKLNKPGSLNSWDYEPVVSSNKRHPTERPIELTQDIIETFVLKGSNIVTPFAGSGNTILAANNYYCNCLGWDLSTEYNTSYKAFVLDPKFTFRNYWTK